MTPTSSPRVYVVVLNWNGWKHTVQCLESLLRSAYANMCVVVCDNGSTDGSLDQLIAWASGRLIPEPLPKPHLQSLVSPLLAKPIEYTRLNRAQAEAGGGDVAPTKLVFVQTGANLGFAGGCNVGARYAVARGDADFVWFLNNDTLVKPDALSQLVVHATADPNIGLCGSTLLAFDHPARVQALGGAIYQPWSGRTWHIGVGTSLDTHRINPAEVERQMDYVVGASMMASRRFLDEVGLMTEDYFLYFEELDWVLRGRKRFRLGYAPKSIVYHIEGASSGFSNNYFYLYRNAVRVTARFHPWWVPLVVLRLAGKFVSAVIRGQHDEVRLFLSSRFLTKALQR